MPTWTAFAVVNLLELHFPSLVDYGFTASMEDDLDEIASGGAQAVPWLESFYFGASRNGATTQGLKTAVAEHLGSIDAREINSIPIGADDDGEVIVVRVGRYGPYLQRGEASVGVPEDVAPDELTVERALELLSAPSGDRHLGDHPETGLAVLARAGRYGPYVQHGEAGVGASKPQTSSLFKSMTLDTLTLDQALALLSLPRTVGVDPATGEEIVARNGRYGPYLQRGNDSRSLESEEQLLEITLEEALAQLAKPKERRFGRAGSAAPLREIGADPESGAPIVLRSGRFGPYVTDGTTNASLRRGDDPETVTLERAAELLAERRAAAPATGRSGRSGRAAAKSGGARAKAAGAKKTASPRKAAGKGAAAGTTAKRAGAAKKAASPSRSGAAKKSASPSRSGAAKKSASTAAAGSSTRAAATTRSRAVKKAGTVTGDEAPPA